MDLVVNKVMELKVVHDPDGDGVVEGLACSAVVKGHLARFVHARHFEALRDILFLCAVKDRGHDLPAETLCRDSEVNLKHLTDVHSRRHAHRVEDYIKGSAVCHERHILRREDP